MEQEQIVLCHGKVTEYFNNDDELIGLLYPKDIVTISRWILHKNRGKTPDDNKFWQIKKLRNIDNADLHIMKEYRQYCYECAIEERITNE